MDIHVYHHVKFEPPLPPTTEQLEALRLVLVDLVGKIDALGTDRAALTALSEQMAATTARWTQAADAATQP